MKRALFICRAGRAHGTGHYVRAKRYAACLPDATFETYIAVLSEEFHLDDSARSAEVFHETSRLERILEKFPSPDLIVFDTRETPLRLYREARRLVKPVLSFDDYGLGRVESECAANILPHFETKNANFTELKYNPLEQGAPTVKPSGGILIAFGGSDPAGIGEKAARALSGIGREVVWVRGALTKGDIPKGLDGVKILGPQPSLAPFIANSDTVVTTVGLTMIEALNLGRKVVGIHPTDYHTRVAGSVEQLTDLGHVKSFSPARLREACREPFPVMDTGGFDSGAAREWFAALTGTLIDNGAAVCPMCGSGARRALARDSELTLFECRDCRTNYGYAVSKVKQDYSKDYFEETYKKAYGKTYEEDIAAIREYSARRLSEIECLLKPGIGKKRILDIGCALGVFVNEARARGWESEGAEVSAHAREFARGHFGLDIHDDTAKAQGLFDCVTFWFTLEHMKNPALWIERARGLLKPGGILALGLPHSRGWYALKNRDEYLTARPREHEFEPSIPAIKRLLINRGFGTRRLNIFGLHPARAGLPEWEFVKRLQALIKRGDTFEIYAEKLA